MEQDNSKVAWGKALKPIFALLLVIVLWQGEAEIINKLYD